ncbi:unnamed protein product, partial [marine sediment metagenome]
MPLYEYQCECGNEEEVLLPFQHPGQICECGKVMQLKVSSYSFAFKQYARDMAKDSLNSRGGGFPDVNK